ncbi:MAG TPA: sulfotransferase domain-containing protein [Phenylobacterium sp.]|uniref:sulfotransferase domain-containing protein n=1 Tax=Phenylobacterium sp. TaxID=1871053 RepID=UPI002B98E70B|nr:sulfotransferase domain-containing protein [Phenylobacterium sp.]HSV03837.1 sulfotransferase domain-containing protein [Phenylobacterium sp.]
MDQIAPHRARSLAEFAAIAGKMFAPEDVAASVASYRPRASDVIISPFGKCGTTWLQQIFHTLRTGGDLDFDDISRVVPWIETAAITGVDLEAPQKAEPRGFKSHLGHDRAPKGARYIVAFRDPKDALVSMYHFMSGWFLEPGAVSIGEFGMTWSGRAERGSAYWSHLTGWWGRRDDPNVLLLSYEQMLADAEGTIRRVAAFCGLPLDQALLELTLERSSIGFMLEHKSKFDDLLMRTASERRCNLPPGSDSAKVRKGGSGAGRQELPPEIAEMLDEQWRTLVAPQLGFADYAAFEQALRERAVQPA